MSYMNPFGYAQGGYMPPQFQGIIQSQTAPVNQGYQNGINWVQGEIGAKSFQLPVNATAILLDSEDSFFYIKATDNTGMATLRKFRFEEVKEEPKLSGGASDYVTRAEFQELKGKLEALFAPINNVNNQEVVNNEPTVKNAGT